MKTFDMKLRQIQDSERGSIERGAVTESYKKKESVQILNEALGTELMSALRYRQNWQDASGIESKSVTNEFFQHPQQNLGHADPIVERISQLGGSPNFNPEGLKNSQVKFFKSDFLEEMIVENLVAERVSIDISRMMVEFFGPQVSTTRRMLEEILAEDEHHAGKIAELLHPTQLTNYGSKPSSHWK